MPDTTDQAVTAPEAAPEAAVPAATFTPEQFERMMSMFAQAQTGGGIDKDTLAELLVQTQKTTAKAMRPENDRHPGRSAMSYPEGDVERPRPQIVGEFWYNGYPQHKFQEELHWSEAELIVQVKPGVYPCMDTNGRTSRDVEVKQRFHANGTLERTDVTFPISRENSNMRPPLYVWLFQMVHGAEYRSPGESFMVGMTKYLQIMFDDEQAKQPVH